jgi:hypothetical protein
VPSGGKYYELNWMYPLRLRTVFTNSILYAFSYVTAADWLDNSGFDPRQEQGIFLFSKMTRAALVPTLLCNRWEHGALSPGAQRPAREADHSSQFNAKVKNEWSSTFTPTSYMYGIH